MRRTNAAYFSFCNAHHVPDVTDLVIVELDTDDDGCVTFIVSPAVLERVIKLRICDFLCLQGPRVDGQL